MFPSASLLISGLRGSTEWIQRLQEQEYYVDLIGSNSSEGGAGTEELMLIPTDPINYSLIFTLSALSILFVVGMCILCVRKRGEGQHDHKPLSVSGGDSNGCHLAQVDNVANEYKTWF